MFSKYDRSRDPVDAISLADFRIDQFSFSSHLTSALLGSCQNVISGQEKESDPFYTQLYNGDVTYCSGENIENQMINFIDLLCSVVD
jgi:hypothetical protein